jgi:NAD(P)-dependent dehydrogenase (short-subunit alcohol dehydrogenase family)
MLHETPFQRLAAGEVHSMSVASSSNPTRHSSLKAKWTTADIPDLSRRVAIVTGSSGGVGYEIAFALANHGAHVILAARDRTRTSEAAARISASVPGATVEARVLDLANLASVRRFAEDVAGRYPAVDILVNNAGVSGGPRRVTVDGFEVHFQVNHLAHFALTGLLLPMLRKRPGARVVSVSSEVASSGRIDFDDLQANHDYNFVKAYAQSKLANLLFAFEFERRSLASGAGVSSFASHPGVAKSSLFVGKEADWGRPRRGMESLVHVVQLFLGQSAAMSALPALYQATEPSAQTADYVGPSGLLHGRGYPGVGKIPKVALDQDVARRLWEVSTELTAVTYREQ